MGMLKYALAFCAPAGRVTVLACEGASGHDAEASLSELCPVIAMYNAGHEKISLVNALPGESVGEAIAALGRKLCSDLIIVAMQGDSSGAIANRRHTTVIEDIALTERIPVMALRPEMMTQSTDAAPVQRIVVPLDGSAASRQALPVATALAHQFGAAVHLITVIDPTRTLPTAYAYLPASDPDRRDALAWMTYQANQSLDRAEATLRAAGVPASSVLLQGSTPDCLLWTIAAGDLVVMATHGDGKGTQSRFGSVAFAVVRESPVPVIVLNSPPWTLPEDRGRARWMLDADARGDASPAHSHGDFHSPVSPL
jgi:nucleotide-binding universal stress UspA family protein